MLTPSQQQALDTTRNLSVTANAGSGKTLVLVKRFAAILQQPGVEPENIAAITFTDAAAGELRVKIAGEINEALSQDPANTRLRRISADIHSAFIGTIHAFCTSILHAYPIESAVDAEFTVLDTNDQNLFIEEAIDEEFLAVLTPDAPGYVRWRKLFLQIGRTAAAMIVRAAIRKRELWSALTDFYHQSDEAILAHWEALLTKEKESLLAAFPYGEVENILNGKKSNDKINTAKQMLLQMKSGGTIEQRFESLHSLLAILLTQKLTLNTNIIGRGKQAEYRKLETTLAAIHEKTEIFSSPDDSGGRTSGMRAMLAHTRALLTLAHNANERYEQKKERSGALDFDDLQLKTVRVLREEPEIRHELQKQYTYIMVDEFQDTNRLQYELVTLLTENHTKGNLFIVGDAKQSIYGFRNAEVEVFRAATDAIAGADGGEAIALNESFRMLPAAAGFVNYVFKRLMRDDAVEYLPLVPSPVRKSADANLLPGYVEIMLPDFQPPDSEDGKQTENAGDGSSDENTNDFTETETTIPEEEYVARRILDLAGANADDIRVYDREGVRSPQFSDIAILIRSRGSALPLLESALSRNGIPFRIEGGIGFYQRQEILDVINYLHVMLNPDDDVSLLGIFRSPFFTISDIELFAIVAETEGAKAAQSLWAKAHSYTSTPAASQSLKDAVLRLAADRVLARKLSLTELLYRITVETGWIGSIAGNIEFAEQARANVAKLIEIARGYEQRGFSSLYDFIEYLDTLAEGANTEGQAATAEKGNAVQIMTVHAAKGLEFPIVMLPFLGAKVNHKSTVFFDSALGMGCRTGADEDSEIYHYMKRRHDGKEDEEERRIFYVACTRARDALILSGAGAYKDSWRAWLQFALEEHLAPDSTIQLHDESGTAFSVRIRTTPQTISPLQNGADTGENGGEHEQKLPEIAPEIAIEEIPDESKGEFFSASHFATHAQCPMKYTLRYLLGVQEEHAPRYTPDREGNDQIYGSAIGTIAHAALELMDAHASQIHDDEMFGKIVFSAARKVVQDEREAAAIAEKVSDMLMRASRSDVWKKIFNAETFYCEYEISAALGAHFLRGVIDRLYRADNGEWHIVDYKSDKVNPQNAAQKIHAYAMQLNVYAYLVLSLFPKAAGVTTHLVFLRAPELSREERIARSAYSELKETLKTQLAVMIQTHNDPIHAVQNWRHCPECPFHVARNGIMECLIS